MEKIQEILFENKESIPDGVYLELMNNLKIDAGKYYKIEYMKVITRLFWDSDDTDINITFHSSTKYGHYSACQQTHEIIIRCDNPKIREHQRKLLDEGKPFWTCEFNDFFPPENRRARVRHNTLIKECKCDDHDDYDDDEQLDGHECKTIHITTDFDVSSLYFITKIEKI
jgi:hypothetical protein